MSASTGGPTRSRCVGCGAEVLVYGDRVLPIGACLVCGENEWGRVTEVEG